MKNKTKLSAFTLIELLIVIAIIGILAGLMAGGISAAMDSAKATTIGNNGRNIVQAIMQANNDRVASSQSELWPRVEKFTGKKANDYFYTLMNKELIEGVSYADFAGGGVPAPKDAADLQKGRCVWNVLAGVGKLDAYAPFIWTRNLSKDLSAEDFKESKTDDGADWKKKLDPAITPFQDKRVVLVRRGGAMVDIKASLLTSSTFLGGASNDSSVIEILLASTEDSGSGSSADWDD